MSPEIAKRIRDREVAAAKKLGVTVAHFRALKARAVRRDPGAVVKERTAYQNRIKALTARVEKIEADRTNRQPQTRSIVYGRPRKIIK